MRRVDEYLKANRANWDERALVHAISSDYNLSRYIEDPTVVLDQRGDLQPLADERRHDLAQAVVPFMSCAGSEDQIGLDVRAAALPHTRLLSLEVRKVNNEKAVRARVGKSVPWEALPGQMTRDDHGEWRLRDRPWRLATSYTLQTVRTA
jgi:hypothetical protein